MLLGTKLKCGIVINVIKTIIIKSKSKHTKSKTHKHKQKHGIVVREHEFIKPDIYEVNYILIDTIKDCRKKYFHSFQYRCVYAIIFTNVEKNEVVISSIALEYHKFKSQYYGLSRKIRNA